jgi:hypothetical protein
MTDREMLLYARFPFVSRSSGPVCPHREFLPA